MADPAFELWLEFEHWVPQEDDDPEDDFINMSVTLPTGVRYALNVWTYKFLERARQDAQYYGDNLGGKYLLPPDLFVERLDRDLLERIVADMIETNRLRKDWIVEDQAEDDV